MNNTSSQVIHYCKPMLAEHIQWPSTAELTTKVSSWPRTNDEPNASLVHQKTSGHCGMHML